MKNFTQKIFGFAAFLLLAVSMNAQVPFWTEDFDGGIPADWTALEVAGNNNASSNWVWTDAGPMGQFPTDPLASTTAANGWMMFDSDLNCSGEQNVWLITPQLDLSTRDLVILQFENLYREFNSLVELQVSTDSMLWTPFQLFPDAQNGDFSDSPANNNPHKVTVDLTSTAANESSVWIAFQFLADSTTIEAGTDVGCGYNWQIDDVALLDVDPTPPVDLALVDYFYPPLSFATPSSQIDWDTMGFSGNVANLGTADATNVVLKATVSSQGNVLFEDSIVVDNIPVGTTDSLLIVPSLYPPALDQGTYFIDYELYSLDGADGDLSNNTVSRAYVVTEDLWSKDNGPTIAFNIGGGDYDIANVYWTSPNLIETYYAISTTFSAATNATDGPLANFGNNIILTEVDEAEILPDWSNFDTDVNYITNEGLNIVSFTPHTFTGTNFSDQTVNFEDFDTGEPGVELKAGTRYILIASYEGANNVVFHGHDEATVHDAISSLVFNGNWFLGGFEDQPAAHLRMTISMSVDVEDKLSPELVANIFPNPVNDHFNLELNFEKPELVNVTIANLDGRVVSTDIMENVQQVNKQYNVSNLPAGTYLVRVTTEEGSRTQKVVVVD
ncbi:MAG: T9SS type A sorting domain-containing protein [Bacteroidota bacterium]